MKWLLVVIVMNTPIKTDLVFDSFSACLSAEVEMRRQWVEAINEMVRRKDPKPNIDFVTSQATHGTCIPSK